MVGTFSLSGVVKGLGCLLASQSYPCRNPRSARIALWVLLFWCGPAGASILGVWRCERTKKTSTGLRSSIGVGGFDEIGVHDADRCAAAHKPSYRPVTGRGRLNELLMPGHGRSHGSTSWPRVVRVACIQKRSSR